jgi:hypothetical protein
VSATSASSARIKIFALESSRQLFRGGYLPPIPPSNSVAIARDHAG